MLCSAAQAKVVKHSVSHKVTMGSKEVVILCTHTADAMMYHIEMLWTHSKHTWFRLNQARSSAAPFHSRGWSCEAPNPQCRSIPQQRLAMWSPPVNTNYSVLRLHCGGTFAYTYGKTRRPSGMLGPWKVQDKTPFAASVLRF